jgi:hypothetical protein
MNFWFNRYNGLSFPLIAMQYNELVFSLTLKKLEQVLSIERIYLVTIEDSSQNQEIVRLTGPQIEYLTNLNLNIINVQIDNSINITDIFTDQLDMNASLTFDYIYLDTEQRRRFAQSGHEYLIDRIQTEQFDDLSKIRENVKLDFYNPSKQLIWIAHKNIYQENNIYIRNRWNDYTDGDNNNPILTSQIDLNTHNRVLKLDSGYYNHYQSNTYHTNSIRKGINMYSFALHPQQYQPTGSCNFSRISEINLKLELDDNLYSYQDIDIYPIDNDFSFDIEINNLDVFIGTIDETFVNDQIASLENIPDKQELLEKYQTIRNLFMEFPNNTQLQNENKINIPYDIFRIIPIITTSSLFVFSHSLNVLRLIGGYGGLAYSGKN